MHLLAVLVTSLLAFGSGTPKFAEARPDCWSLFEDDAPLASDWGLLRSPEAEIRDWFRGGTRSIQQLRRLAQFIDDPGNAEFFDFFGAYANVGLTQKSMERFLGQPASMVRHRAVQVETVLEIATQSGLYPSEFRSSKFEAFLNALPELPLQEAFDPTTLADINHVLARLEKFSERRQIESWPSLRQMGLQSVRTQWAWLLQALSRFGSTSLPMQPFVDGFHRRLRGDIAPTESGLERLVFDQVERVMARDPQTLFDIFGSNYQGTPTQSRRKLVLRYEKKQILMALRALLRLVPDFYAEKSDRFNPYIDSPLTAVQAFEEILARDAFVDQGIVNFFRRAFVVVAFDQPVLDGRQVRRMVRSRLIKKLDRLADIRREALRGDQRASVIENKVSEPIPARAERMRAYAEGKQNDFSQTHNGDDQDLEIEDRSSEPNLGLSADSKSKSFWEMMLDRERDLNEARALFRELVRPGVPIALDPRRIGYQYSVEFSDKLIRRLLNPAKDEPEDLREWLAAIEWGPTRQFGQRGWKKLFIVVRGLYDREIKLLHSTHRLLGYKVAPGRWRFETIEQLH